MSSEAAEGDPLEPRVPIRLVPTVQALMIASDFPDGALLPHPSTPSVRLPLFGHKVKADFPSPADDYVEAWLDLNEHLIEHKDATFFVQASGDSMTGAGIQEGNLLVMDRALEAKYGDIVIAVIDGDTSPANECSPRRWRASPLWYCPTTTAAWWQGAPRLGRDVCVTMASRSPS